VAIVAPFSCIPRTMKALFSVCPKSIAYASSIYVLGQILRLYL
jgi:hypothetical protein